MALGEAWIVASGEMHEPPEVHQRKPLSPSCCLSRTVLTLVQDAYDKALQEFDVLVMPTLPHPAPKLPETGYEEGLLKFAKRTTGMVANTSPFDSESFSIPRRHVATNK